MTKTGPRYPSSSVRNDYVPAEDFSPEFMRAEEKYLWPSVWQLACRLEEIPQVGDYVTYDIVDDSIIVVRSGPEAVKAFHNVCPHRGRALTEGCGHVANQFVCRFHGWRFDLQGENIEVVDRKDWGGCLADEDTRLSEVRVGFWGGFVWINMDEDAEPLEQFLAPIIERTRLHRLEELRYRWYRTVRVDANWKVAVTAFDEAYHVAQTHPE